MYNNSILFRQKNNAQTESQPPAYQAESGPGSVIFLIYHSDGSPLLGCVIIFIFTFFSSNAVHSFLFYFALCFFVATF